jgi:hypothetical protein
LVPREPDAARDRHRDRRRLLLPDDDRLVLTGRGRLLADAVVCTY